VRLCPTSKTTTLAPSSARVLSQIAVPTLIITAASDPIVPVASFEAASYSPATQLIVASCGGHLGFIAARGADPRDRRWLDLADRRQIGFIQDWYTLSPKRKRG